jgi:hypothetical protein
MSEALPAAQALELLERYRVTLKLEGDRLLDAIDRHERVIRAFDPEVARALRDLGKEL